MPNLIIGLKYQPKYQRLDTEEQLFEVFDDLKQQYNKFNPTFIISTPTNSRIKNFKQFLKLATEEEQTVIISGTGDIGGLRVRDGSLEYDISALGDLLKVWDRHRDGSCNSCYNCGVESVDQDWVRAYCGVGIKPMRSNCEKYDPHIKNSEGKAAQKLDELIKEYCKSN